MSNGRNRLFLFGLVRRGWLISAAAVLMAGCGTERTQSALHPAGPAAAKIALLSWILFAGATAVFFLVLVLLLIAVLRRRQEDESLPPLGRHGFIVTGGILLPVFVVVPLLIYSLETSQALQMPDDTLTVRVIGHQWWWEVHYPEQGIVTANEIPIPAGRPVRLELTSADVIHSFWVPELNGKRDLIPGRLNEFWIQADRPGIYRGQCAEYCGLQHAHMAFLVTALTPEEFDQWAAARQQPESTPQTERQSQGLELFLRAGCSRCHTIRGTEAQGKVGPDLTHIGSRRTLGAGTIRNTPGNLMGWIGNAQGVKPGVRMPPSYLQTEELHALASYLDTLQ